MIRHLRLGTLSGQFDTLTLPAFRDPAFSWDANDLYSTGTLSVVPEHATLTLLALGGLAVVGRRSRTVGKATWSEDASTSAPAGTSRS